jgi:hypothetical protein
MQAEVRHNLAAIIQTEHSINDANEFRGQVNRTIMAAVGSGAVMIGPQPGSERPAQRRRASGQRNRSPRCTHFDYRQAVRGQNE